MLQVIYSKEICREDPNEKLQETFLGKLLSLTTADWRVLINTLGANERQLLNSNSPEFPELPRRRRRISSSFLHLFDAASSLIYSSIQSPTPTPSFLSFQTSSWKCLPLLHHSSLECTQAIWRKRCLQQLLWILIHLYSLFHLQSIF